jgi:hypothetical protein
MHTDAIEKGKKMVRRKQQKLEIYCKQEYFEQWKSALSVYDVSFANPEIPLLQLMQEAAKNDVDLFVITDNTQESDADVVQAIQTMRESDTALKPSLRIAFAAGEQREIPNYLFRVLSNLDVYDFASPRLQEQGAKSVYVQIADLLFCPKTYSEALPFFSDVVVNPYLIGLSDAVRLRENTRSQTRIALAQIDKRRGGSTHTTFILARVLALLGNKVAVFLSVSTWDSLRRAYPRARHNLAYGAISLCGIDFYRNLGFAQINGYDYVLADFGCAEWIDIAPSKEALDLEQNFKTAQLGILTSVVSPFGDHSSFERVLKIWQRNETLHDLGGVKFAFFGIPNEGVLKNWESVAKNLNPKAELYALPYLPDPLHYEFHEEQGEDAMGEGAQCEGTYGALRQGEGAHGDSACGYGVRDENGQGLLSQDEIAHDANRTSKKKQLTCEPVLLDLLASVFHSKGNRSFESRY